MVGNSHDGDSRPSHHAAGDVSAPSIITSEATDDSPANNDAAASSLRGTIRAVTPDPVEQMDVNNLRTLSRTSDTSSSQQTSPRSILGGERRRQGIVFHDEVFDGQLILRQTSAATGIDLRHKIGSISAPNSENDGQPIPASLDSLPSRTLPSAREFDQRSSKKDKLPSAKRLVKKGSSRPSSPLASPPPSVDSLPLPIPTDDANRILSYMKRLCGRMKGKVEYQSDPHAPWHEGICYIDEDRGSLMFDCGHQGPFHISLIEDLRGCRVTPSKTPDGGSRCLELYSARAGVELLFHPLVPEEYDLWLASLLCWQQIRPPGGRLTNHRLPNSPGSRRPDTRRRGSSAAAATGSPKDPAIIKVGTIMLWDKGAPTSPHAIIKRPSTRDLRSSATSWRRVSCILQDNGELKLMNENDVSVLSVIDLSQLSRSAIQKLDRSVLDEEFCVAIFPIYSSTSKQLSIFRPVYLALDSRVLFEVWFVLLRAFAVPDLYGIETSSGQITEIRTPTEEFDGQVFRIEKSIQVRVVEAKIQRLNFSKPCGRNKDPLVGHYLSEVILDGEVRSRTTLQMDTKNPFWRDTAQFSELPSNLPNLTVVMKRLDGNVDSYDAHMHNNSGLSNANSLNEMMCGVVEVPLEKIEKAKDHEEWYQAYDEKQESIGSMLIRLEHDELVVLTSQDYKPMSELLHQFSSGLTSQITHSSPRMMKRLSETFLNIFQVSGTATQWLMALVEDEIDGVGNNNSMKRLRFSRRMKSNESSTSASDREQLVRDMSKSLTGEANLLFRGNTLLTQALECHMRRLGKEYLEEILGDKIYEINEINPDCEVDPSRLGNDEDLLQQHWNHLLQFTNEVWATITASVRKFPSELRGILKYVRAVAEDRYGDFLRTVNYTSVSGFLFLRFICPAILNPKLFGLLRDNPRPRAQRTLTLIAKGLQALANVSPGFGRKESWMEPMNKFLSTHRQSFKHYIDEICSVSAEQIPVITSASYSTPIMILGRLPPNAREGFPSLPYLIDHQRNFATLVKIWLEAHRSTTPEPHILGGELGEFHTLCVKLQARSDECLAQVEAVRAAAEDESVGTDDLTDNLEKASLLESLNPSYASSAVWMESDPYRPPESPGSEVEGQDGATHRRHAREISSLRHFADGFDFTNPLDTIRAPKHKAPRGFLSSLIGGKKSKETSLSSTMRNKGRDEKGARNVLGNLSESWQANDSSWRH
ncbi:Rho GTPase activation protein [Xylariaceae sp. FL0255]|nr:Rho GTPase activation protein [Xylariaceae sp. FL0255]